MFFVMIWEREKEKLAYASYQIRIKWHQSVMSSKTCMICIMMVSVDGTTSLLSTSSSPGRFASVAADATATDSSQHSCVRMSSRQTMRCDDEMTSSTGNFHATRCACVWHTLEDRLVDTWAYVKIDVYVHRRSSFANDSKPSPPGID